MDKDLDKLKEDKEFLKELEEKRDEALKKGDIVLLYDVLDTYLLLDRDDDIDTIYQKILEIAFDRLADMLTKGEVFNLSNEEDLQVARAIYEHALERWNRNDFKGSNELFLILSYIILDEKIQEGMFLALGATAKKISLDEFINSFIDVKNLDENSLFFDRFTKKAKDFLEDEKDLINKELKKIQKIAKGAK